MPYWRFRMYTSYVSLSTLKFLGSIYWQVAIITFALLIANPVWTAIYGIIFRMETGRWISASAMQNPVEGFAWRVFIIFGLGVLIQLLIAGCDFATKNKQAIAGFLGIHLIEGNGDSDLPDSQSEGG